MHRPSIPDSCTNNSKDADEFSLGRFGQTTPQKSLEVDVVNSLKAETQLKRSEIAMEDGEQSVTSEASENVTPITGKKGYRASECSHKVIEKRRRDRINTSLGELSQLLPAQTSSGKQGSGKLEKAEILELTVDYLKSLKSHLNEQQEKDLKKAQTVNTDKSTEDSEVKPVNHFGGYKDCTEEVFRFLVNVEAMDMQQPCFQRLMAHLRHQIQLMVESNDPEATLKSKVTTESGKRMASKRNFQGTTSSSSSTSSSTGKGSANGGKIKRARLHGHLGGSNATPSQSSNGNTTSNSSDNENGSDNTRETQSDSAICLEDDLPEIPGNSGKEAENGNTANGSNENASRGGHSNGHPTHPLPSMLSQGNNIPLRTPFLAPPYTMPTYALHPAGTHYIPVALHPNIPLPVPSASAFNGSGSMPFPTVPPGAGMFGMPPQVPNAFGFPLPYFHPCIPPYNYQAPAAMGLPLFNGLRKDLTSQGNANHYNGDSGSNGDDCSIESRNSSESIAIQTDTSSGNESSNPDEGAN